MAALASDSDSGLDALLGSDSDESVGAAEALDVLDALVAPARPSQNSDRTKVARGVKLALAKNKKKKQSFMVIQMVSLSNMLHSQ